MHCLPLGLSKLFSCQVLSLLGHPIKIHHLSPNIQKPLPGLFSQQLLFRLISDPGRILTTCSREAHKTRELQTFGAPSQGTEKGWLTWIPFSTGQPEQSFRTVNQIPAHPFIDFLMPLDKIPNFCMPCKAGYEPSCLFWLHGLHPPPVVYVPALLDMWQALHCLYNTVPSTQNALPSA